MIRFLFCSTVFNRKQYTIIDYSKQQKIVEAVNYLLHHRQNPVFWPLVTREDADEVIGMDRKILEPMLRKIEFNKQPCRVRYNGIVYEVEEITLSSSIPTYWHIHTNNGDQLFDPNYIELL
jgi:hypothetical protein